MHKSTDMYIEMPFSDCIIRLICIYIDIDIHISRMMHKSTDMYIEMQFSDCVIRLICIYIDIDIHISRMMQSENGISIYISVDLCNQKTAYYCCFTYF